MKIIKNLLLVAFFAINPLTVAAPANSEAEAKAHVERLSNETLRLIQSGKFDTEASAVKTFSSLFDKSFHLPYMVGFVLSRAARGKSREQIQRFSKAFRRKIINSYATRFSEYKGATSKIINVSKSGKDKYKVKSKIVKNKEYNVVWTVKFYKGSPKIVAVAVEGVDLAYSYRTQYQNIIKQSGFDGLLNRIG